MSNQEKDLPEFLTLADEILLQVLELVEAQDLFALSTLSRRLHHLALPLYFSQQHVEHDKVGKALSLTDDNISALLGFQISLFTTSLGSLSCTLKNDGTPSVFRMTNRLTNVMSNLSQVDEVSFRLEGFETNIDPVEWYKVFVTLLQLVVDKSCTKLEVHGSELPLPPDDVQINVSPSLDRTSPLFSRVRDGLKLLFVGSKRRELKTVKDPTQDAPRVFSGSLISFYIHSAMLILPPFDTWTIKTLNSSPITFLSVETLVEHLPPQWPAFLTFLDLPKITSFHMNLPRMSLSVYSQFVARHPLLTNCQLQIDDILLIASHTSADHTAPSTVFTASAALVPGLFEFISSYPPMKIMVISAQICQDILEQLDIQVLDNALRCVAKHRDPITLIIKVIGRCGNWLDLEWTGGRRKRAERSLKCVTKLELKIRWMPWNYRETIPAWLGLFPAIESVKLPNVDAGDEGGLVDFIRLISKANRRIKTLHIQDREQTIEEWLTTGK